jgi:hypothetical protein
MPVFQRKEWLDACVVQPLLKTDPSLSLYSVFWNGHPPKDVLVLLLCKKPEDWPAAAKRIMAMGLRFDYLRDVQLVEIEGARHALFGGDGAPLFDKSGSVSIRFFQKDAGQSGVNLILQIGAKCDNAGGLGAGVEAAALVKEFFAQFAENPMLVCQKFSAPFGQA